MNQPPRPMQGDVIQEEGAAVFVPGPRPLQMTRHRQPVRVYPTTNNDQVVDCGWPGLPSKAEWTRQPLGQPGCFVCLLQSGGMQ